MTVILSFSVALYVVPSHLLPALVLPEAVCSMLGAQLLLGLAGAYAYVGRRQRGARTAG